VKEVMLPAATLREFAAVFRRYSELEQVILFGSRATGRATEWSDIDLATRGIVDRHRLGRLSLDLDEIAIPQECEVHAYEQIDYAPLKAHIDRWGVPIYQAGAGAGLQSAVSSAERGTAAPHTSVRTR
jgi:predicted nucleotidyltransferase